MSATDFCVVDAQQYAHHIERFSSLYPEGIVNAIPDRDAWTWMQTNVPLLDCSDAKIAEIYYFRWWIYRKHIRDTPHGYVVSEFLHDVGHAAKHNTINCPV